MGNYYSRAFQTFRKVLKRSFDRINNEKIKRNILQALPFWVASIITGLTAVFYSKVFAYLEYLGLSIFHHHNWAIFILSPVCFLIAWWLVIRFAPNARTSGIPQVMAAIELANPRHDKKVGKLLSLRILVIKILSSFFMIFGGGAIGKEGPTIQMAGTIFRKINEWLPSWWPKISKRNMIMAGAAAGLAAAFNTPLGGIVFAVEELTKVHFSYFKTSLFTAVIIAGLTAQGLLGSYLYLGFPDVTHLSKLIIFPVLLVAAIAGLLGSLMSKVILIIFDWKKKFKGKNQHILYALSCGIIIAAIAFFFDPRILGSGKQIMTTSLFTVNKNVHWYTAIFRILGTTLSFTTDASGGIFAPALGAGAGVGSLLAGWLGVSASGSNLLILCGMVGLLTGVTRTPFTSAILVLEMTDRNSVIFHLMIAALVASIVSLLVDKHSLYDHIGVNFLHNLQHENNDLTPPPASK
ncbi:MAG: chloride channel protein [Bacteroidota bacterium]|nr:chloride channel protein [Bacteroidota bacterium]